MLEETLYLSENQLCLPHRVQYLQSPSLVTHLGPWAKVGMSAIFDRLIDKSEGLGQPSTVHTYVCQSAGDRRCLT